MLVGFVKANMWASNTVIFSSEQTLKAVLMAVQVAYKHGNIHFNVLEATRMQATINLKINIFAERNNMEWSLLLILCAEKTPNLDEYYSFFIKFCH